MAIIEVNHLTKEYQLGHLTSLKDTALNALRRLTFQPTQDREDFKALDDVNFHIEEGEVVGIIGHNGAGKSTLLKHLANISKPTKGEVIVRGSVAPLIEVGAGVNPELTGRENIFLNGAILGIPKKIIRQKLEEIIDFSELEQFIDTPVKRYSSGMTVKLGFSIATSMEADILIVDEVLAVGDLAFQRKCFDKMEDLIIHQGKTVLLVSHNIRQVERICKRVILMDHGMVLADGPSNEVCGKFFEQSDAKIKKEASNKHRNKKFNDETFSAELLDAYITDPSGCRTETIPYKSKVTFNAKFYIRDPLRDATFGFGIHTTDLLYLATEISEGVFDGRTLEPGVYCISLTINEFPFLPGVYSLRMGITAEEGCRTIFYGENITHLQITSPEFIRTQAMREGFVTIHGDWAIESHSNL